jgi:hypothetical protein
MEATVMYETLGQSIELASQVLREAAEEARRRRMMSSAYELVVYAYDLRSLSDFVRREAINRSDRAAAADEVFSVVSGASRPAVVAGLKALRLDGTDEANQAVQVLTQATGIGPDESCEPDVQLGLEAFAAAKSRRQR